MSAKDAETCKATTTKKAWKHPRAVTCFNCVRRMQRRETKR